MINYSSINFFFHPDHTESRQISLFFDGKCHVLLSRLVKPVGFLPGSLTFLPEEHAEFISPCRSRYIGSSPCSFHHATILRYNGTRLELVHYIPGIVHEHHPEVPLPCVGHLSCIEVKPGPIPKEAKHIPFIPIDVSAIFHRTRLNIEPVAFRAGKHDIIRFTKSAPVAYVNRELLQVNGAVVSPLQCQSISIGLASLPLVGLRNVIGTFLPVNNDGKGYSFR